MSVLSHFFAFIFVGFVQIATAFWGGVVSVKALPEGESKLKHYGIFLFLGILGLILTVWVGLQTYDAEEEAIARQKQAEANEKTTQGKLDQSLLSQENIKGLLTGLAITMEKSGNPANDQLSAVVKRFSQPPPVNSILDAMTNPQLQESALAFVKQMRDTDAQFERQTREMTDRHWQAERQIPMDQKVQFTELRDKDNAELLRWLAAQDNEFRNKYLGRAVSLRDQMLKRIPPDKVPQVDNGSASLDFGHLLGATTIGRVADFLEQLALRLPMK